MTEQFKRILDLVRKTGDTMVVIDPDGKDVFVVMDMRKYEKMLETETVAGAVEAEEVGESDIWEAMKPAGEKGETWDLSKMNENELKNLEDQYRQFSEKTVKEAIQKKADSDDFSEEAFYLEPVE